MEEEEERRVELQIKESESSTLELVRQVVTFAVPVAGAAMMQYLLSPITMAMIGPLGPNAIGAVSLSTSLINSTAYAAIIGFCGALDTILGQIYGRDPLDPHYGTVVLRVLLMLMWMLVPFGAIISYVDVILEALNMPADVIEPTVTYARIQMFGLPAMVVLEVLRRYLQYQNVTMPIMLVQGAFIGVHVVLQYLVVRVFGLGLVGSAAAWSLLMVGMDIALLAYVWARWSTFAPTFPRVSPAAVRGWGSVFKEGLPSYGMTVVEWSAFELSNMLCGYLGATDLAAYSIVLQCYMLHWSVCNGFYYGAAFMAAENIGAGTPLRGRRGVLVTWALNMCLIAVNIAIMVFLGEYVASYFTTDEAVIARAAQVFRMAGVFHLFDSNQSWYINVTKGVGLQRYGAVITSITWIIVGFPLNWYFAFVVGLGAVGLYLGFTLATATVSIPLFTILVFHRTDWKSLRPVAGAVEVV